MSMMNIGLSGVMANRVSLNTTALNIANVNTEGFSRQSANLVSISGSAGTSGGVSVESVRRISDQYVVQQLWSANNQAVHSSSFASNMGTIEGIMGSELMDISAGLNDIFAAANELTVRPESIPYRQQFISTANTLVNQFSMISNSLNSEGAKLADNSKTIVSEINAQLAGISTYNEKITASKAAGENTSILEDQRDLLVQNLSGNFDISVTEMEDGSLDISMPNGQPLISGSGHATLDQTPTPGSAYEFEIQVVFGQQSFPTQGNLGGAIGAIQKTQADAITPTIATLNEMAENFATRVNSLLSGGTDLNGDPGKPLFTFTSGMAAQSLKITDISPAELGLSSDGTVGDSSIAEALADIANEDFDTEEFGKMTLKESVSVMTGNIGTIAQQAIIESEGAISLLAQSLANQSSISGVSSDEEAANLMQYTSYYNANMKVISTANDLFNSILTAF